MKYTDAFVVSSRQVLGSAVCASTVSSPDRAYSPQPSKAPSAANGAGTWQAHRWLTKGAYRPTTFGSFGATHKANAGIAESLPESLHGVTTRRGSPPL